MVKATASSARERRLTRLALRLEASGDFDAGGARAALGCPARPAVRALRSPPCPLERRAQELPGRGGGIGGELLRSALGDDVPPFGTLFRAEVDQPILSSANVAIVLDD